MNTTGLVKYAGALGALAICSACGGGSAVAPSSAAFNGEYIGRPGSANGALVTEALPKLSGLPHFPTIVPDRRTKPKAFEYIINFDGNNASIFDYPKSIQQIGTISNIGGGRACTNVLYGYGNKMIWIVMTYNNQISEYEIPQTPIKSLSVPYGLPISCAMNSSGDLAAGNYNGEIDIFKHASGSGTAIPTPLSHVYFDAYDNKGNLFFDGLNSSSRVELRELPKGSTKSEVITTSNTVQSPGSVQWDGTYLTVTDEQVDAMYQYAVNGTRATLKGTVSLSGAIECTQPWIATGVVFCADAGGQDGKVFSTRPAVRRLRSSWAILTSRSARWQQRSDLRFLCTQRCRTNVSFGSAESMFWVTAPNQSPNARAHHGCQALSHPSKETGPGAAGSICATRHHIAPNTCHDTRHQHMARAAVRVPLRANEH